MHTVIDSSNSDSGAGRSRPQRIFVAVAIGLLTAGVIGLSRYGWRHSLLFLIGGLLGVTLYQASFGFASAYRKLLLNRDGRGIYAQLVMLAIATILFAPLLATGSFGGQDVRGAIAPIGIQGAIGAFLFGIGMQLGGACGCGTLYTLGSGSLSMLLTLLTFCIGAFAASLTRHLWSGLPTLPPIVLGQTLGWPGAVLLQLVLFAAIAATLRWWNQSHQVRASIKEEPIQSKIQNPKSKLSSLLYGPWSLLAGAIVLAVLNWLTLILSGQPWRVTWGFALWAAQVAASLGWNPASSPFWSNGAGQQALHQGLLADVSSVMNIGLVLGALLAAALAGRLIPNLSRTSRATIGATLLGGLIMGYGAFIAFGCNVSAFFGGIASTSLHGWVWIVAALVGTAIGLRLRPFFQL